MKLHNHVNRKLLKQRAKTSLGERVTLSFYKYSNLQEPLEVRNELYRRWSSLGVLGRIYVAHEGVNAQLSVGKGEYESFKESLYSIPFLKGIRLNIAIEDDSKSFFVLKVQVKKKLVADGLRDDSFDVTDSGAHVNAVEFNKLTDDPQTIIVDMRNHYESEVGHFKNAICPDVDTFKDSLPIVEKMLAEQKEKNIVMYCTGGIRCEKASAWMKHRGFRNVFQLDGGIIEYARQVSEQGLPNKFLGKNFVFDQRMGERISGQVISACHQCGKPCDSHTNCSNDGCHLLFIQCDECAQKFKGCCSERCMEIISLPAVEQKELRRGKAQGRMVFRKGRSGNLKQKDQTHSSQS